VFDDVSVATSSGRLVQTKSKAFLDGMD